MSLRKILELFSTRRFDARYANLQIFALLYKKHFANQKVFKSTRLLPQSLIIVTLCFMVSQRTYNSVCNMF